MEEHRKNALDFFLATNGLKKISLMQMLVVVSNVSFSFRGNENVREAIHAAFLYHASTTEWIWGLLIPQLEVYDEIEKELLERVEDVLLDRRDDATERLLELLKQ